MTGILQKKACAARLNSCYRISVHNKYRKQHPAIIDSATGDTQQEQLVKQSF